MNPLAGSLRHPDEEQRAAVRRLVATWATRVSGTAVGADTIELVDVALLRDGRPGLVDVVARLGGGSTGTGSGTGTGTGTSTRSPDGRLVHTVLGLRRAGDEVHVLGALEDPVLGLIEDEHGLAVAVDAVHDARTAELLFDVVGGPPTEGPVSLERAVGTAPGPTLLVSVIDDPADAVLTFGDDYALRVFSWLRPGAHPGVGLLVALDEAGFHQLPAPVALWRRDGRDLGVLQEHFVDAALGWAVALGSLRDLCARGGAPEEAGGDFAPEARALGTMVARMHLALDRAFGRRPGDVASWVEEAETAVTRVDAAALDGEETTGALRALRGSTQPAPAVRVHGDLHLGRTARTYKGWVLADCTPGGIRTPDGGPVFRSPLADVADVLWSLHHAAVTTATGLARDRFGHPAAEELSVAWEVRNRRAFVAGYLSTAGIAGLVPEDRSAVRDLVALFELERDARIAQRRHPSARPPG